VHPLVYALYEQICVAALETGDTTLANECIAILLKTFPDSARVGRLIGMQKEQSGKFEDALEIYSNLLKKNPANLMILKRRVRSQLCMFARYYGRIVTHSPWRSSSGVRVQGNGRQAATSGGVERRVEAVSRRVVVLG
jgi:tetratricopeptide (TPR) repeat protein